jgi:hypothetical protein
MHGDPGSHLQFQISLLRLMAQKSANQKAVGQKTIGQKAIARRIGLKVVRPSVQVMELERLRLPLGDTVRIK